MGSYVDPGSLYLLCEVVPIDVVAVGVPPRTLDIDPMTLQDCGFLEEKEGRLDLWQIPEDVQQSFSTGGARGGQLPGAERSSKTLMQLTESHITNVGSSLDLFATVGEPVVHFQGGDPLQIGQLLPWNTSHDNDENFIPTHLCPFPNCRPSSCQFLSYLITDGR